MDLKVLSENIRKSVLLLENEVHCSSYTVLAYYLSKDLEKVYREYTKLFMETSDNSRFPGLEVNLPSYRERQAWRILSLYLFAAMVEAGDLPQLRGT